MAGWFAFRGMAGARVAYAMRLTVAALICSLTQVSSPAHALDPTLVEAARKEGRVVWYTSQVIGELALPIAAAFKSTYGIDVSVSRVSSRQIGERLVQAARTRPGGVDIVDGRSAIPLLKRTGLIAPMEWLEASGLPPELRDREGYWIATNLYFNAIAINTDLVAPERRPRSLEDLLRPEWTGKIVSSGQSGLSSAAGFVGAVLREKGEDAGRDYLAKLGGQQITIVDVPSRQIIDKVIAGQFEVGLQVFHHQAAISAKRGEPVTWLPVEPISGSYTAVALTRQAPHPNAARLFIEFLVSASGQALFREAEFLPARPGVGALDNALLPETGEFRALYFTPEEIEAEMPRWQAIRGERFP